MRLHLDKRTTVALIVAVVVIALYATAVAVSKRYYMETSPAGSTFSKGAGGLSILYDYLESDGRRPVALQRFDALPSPDRSTIVIAADTSLGNGPSAGDQRRLEKWVRGGGRLVVAGASAAAAFDRLGTSGSDREASSVTTLAPILPSAEAAGPIVSGRPRLLASNSDWVAHYKDIDGQVLVSKPIGRGQVFWLASAFPLTNAGIGRGANGRIAFRLAIGDGRRPYFDEYHQGYVRGGGLWERLRHRGRVVVLVLLAALAVAFLGWGRRLGAPIPPYERPAARSLAYVGQLAELYRKAGARSEALASLEDGLGRALARRYGTIAAGVAHRPTAAEALAASARLRERGSIGKDEFVAAAETLRRAREEVEGREWLTSRR